MGEDAEVGGNGDDDNNEMIKILSFSKKLNILIGYLTTLYSKKRRIFFDSFWSLLKLLVKKLLERL